LGQEGIPNIFQQFCADYLGGSGVESVGFKPSPLLVLPFTQPTLELQGLQS